jgi:hypothetical protein
VIADGKVERESTRPQHVPHERSEIEDAERRRDRGQRFVTDRKRPEEQVGREVSCGTDNERKLCEHSQAFRKIAPPK